MSKNKSAKFIKKQQNKNKRGQALKGYQHLSEEERNENWQYGHYRCIVLAKNEKQRLHECTKTCYKIRKNEIAL